MEQLARPVEAGVDSIFRTAEVVGDTWSWLVMREAVLYKVSRFADFQSYLGVPRSTLSARLTQLCAAGLLARQPPSARYQLTEAGSDFFGCLMVTMRWGNRWYAEAGPPPDRAVHLDCGQTVDAVLRCSECREVLRARDVTAHRIENGVNATGRTLATRQRKPHLGLLEQNRPCAIARTLNVSGDWWTGLVVQESFFGTRRFDDFQRRLSIAPNILSGRLRALVESNFLEKVQYETWPIRHEYRLTEKGMDYFHVPLAMLTWGRRWLSGQLADPHLVHKLCGREVNALLTCGACTQVVSSADVQLTSNQPDEDLSL